MITVVYIKFPWASIVVLNSRSYFTRWHKLYSQSDAHKYFQEGSAGELSAPFNKVNEADVYATIVHTMVIYCALNVCTNFAYHA